MKTPAYQLIKNEIDEAVFELDIVPELDCFDGHFDGHPVLPGVAQVTFAMRIAQKHFDFKHHFLGMEAVKFRSIITPPCKVQLCLKFDQGKSKINFTYYKATSIYSSGRILV